MDAKKLRSLRPLLSRYLRQFADCFARSDTRDHLPIYVEGQLSDLPRKSVEPMAVAAGVPPRTLQQFLNLLRWDHDRMRDRLQRLVAREHASPHAVGIIDETSFAKKGDKTPGVQRQWCGSTGKKDNCVVTVHLGYAVDDFHCLLDSDLYLPESWAQDRERCRDAGIPDAVDYRSKWEIALELLDRAQANGVALPWLTFDEWYGEKPPFLRALATRQQRYVGEVPTSFTGWLKPPRVTWRRRHRRGAPLTRPRFVAGSRPAVSVATHLQHSPALRAQPWRAYRVKDGQQGPMVWEVKHAFLYPKDEAGRPAVEPLHLVVARYALKRDQLKYFVSNAPPKTPLETLLLVAFSRWHVERCFEDTKTELGLDHYEGRHYLGLKRHQILTAVSHLFLARVQQQWRGEKPRLDRVSGADRSGGRRAVVVALAEASGRTAPTHGRQDRRGPAQQYQSEREPHAPHTTAAPGVRHQTDRSPPLPLARELAL